MSSITSLDNGKEGAYSQYYATAEGDAERRKRKKKKRYHQFWFHVLQPWEV